MLDQISTFGHGKIVVTLFTGSAVLENGCIIGVASVQFSFNLFGWPGVKLIISLGSDPQVQSHTVDSAFFGFLFIAVKDVQKTAELRESFVPQSAQLLVVPLTEVT